MSQCRWNPFTRWFLLAVTLLLSSLVAYLGQTLVYNAAHTHSLEAALAREARTMLAKPLIAPLSLPAAAEGQPSLRNRPQDHLRVVHRPASARKSGVLQTLMSHYLWPLAKIRH